MYIGARIDSRLLASSVYLPSPMLLGRAIVNLELVPKPSLAIDDQYRAELSLLEELSLYILVPGGFNIQGQ